MLLNFLLGKGILLVKILYSNYLFLFLVFLNAFNMFDGINMQSSCYSVIIFLCILLFYNQSLIGKIILISILTYMYLNMKNKTFLGDSGSLLLAFIIGYFFIKLYNLELINHTDDVVVYMLVPGIDLIRLFFKRILLKEIHSAQTDSTFIIFY